MVDTFAKHLKQVQAHANSLYQGISCSLQCARHEQHDTKLYLELRLQLRHDREPKVRFKMILTSKGGHEVNHRLCEEVEIDLLDDCYR